MCSRKKIVTRNKSHLSSRLNLSRFFAGYLKVLDGFGMQVPSTRVDIEHDLDAN